MSKSILRESPLVRFKLEERITRESKAAELVVWERAFCGHINLRGDPADPAFLAAASGVLGLDLPQNPNTVEQGQGCSVFWLGPNEWLIVTPGEHEAATARNLRKALDGLFCAVTEVSGGQTIIVLRGDKVRDLLAKGCPLDLHPREFGPGQCAQSHLAKAPILLRQINDAPTFELVARRSFADYLWLWLEDAAEEYGLTVVKPSSAEMGSPSAPVLSVVGA